MEEYIVLNKKLRKYDGNNTFLLSLQKQLKSTKVKKVEYEGKTVKILSEKQYQIAKELL